MVFKPSSFEEMWPCVVVTWTKVCCGNEDAGVVVTIMVCECVCECVCVSVCVCRCEHR